MKEKTLRVLEFDKILQLLEAKTETSIGKAFMKTVKVSNQIQEINRRLQETSEGVSMILTKGNPPFGGVSGTKDFVKRTQLGGSLTAGALLRVGDGLRASRMMINYLSALTGSSGADSYEVLLTLGKGLRKNTELEEKIMNAIISEEEISDNASSKLKSIRKEIHNKNSLIKSKLNTMITSASVKKYLQDAIVTIRNDRYVVPVRQEYKNQVKGLIHDQSSTGATLFIEPMQIVELNNELSTLAIEERREIERILAELSAYVAEFAEELIENEKIMAELDFIFAKSKFSLEYRCHEPIMNLNRTIKINKGRHPLIPSKEVVPTDIWIGKEFKTLIITGPNTGGKTVCLKTLGLFVLMSQYGLHIPAESGSEIGVFKNIFADIGDEQSIEQSLSTFSSHMKNIVEIFKEIQEDSLVLLDEVGAGTDPTEGAALATAILDTLNAMEVITAATTHYSELKIYALTQEGVTNGSVEFDVETLSPTYKVLIGVPGKSNAFEISSKLGLEGDIIDKARSLIEKNSVEFEEALLQIEKDRRATEEAKLEILKLKQEQQFLKEKTKQQEAKLNDQRDKLIRDAKYEAKRILENAKKESVSIINRLEQFSSKLDKSERREINELRDQLKQNINELSEQTYILKVQEADDEIQNGDHVFIPSLQQKGYVVSERTNDEKVMVQIGSMKFSLPVNTLLKIEEEVPETQKSDKSKRYALRSKNVSTSIDLRGKNLEEAFLEIDKYIDDAYLSGLNEVQLIHGKGTGVLRHGITEYLRKHRLVKEFRLGDFSEGGSGVTIVKLK
jgi:DNA mismatch repair protein MutS2